MSPPGHVVVVGGGIAGLAAAHRLAVDAPGTQVTVVEAGDRWGGKIRTSSFGGVPVDEGADNFIARVPWGVAFARQLGLGQSLTAPATSSALLARSGSLRRLPDGLVLGVPTSLAAVARSGLLSWRGLGRACLDLVKGDNWPGGDETVASLVTRRLGREVNDELVGPLVGSINAGDTDHLSAASAVPQLAEAARRSPSLIRGMLQARADARHRAGHSPGDGAGTRAGDAGGDGPLFLAPRAGMGCLIDAVVAALTAAPQVRMCLGVAAGAIEPAPGGGVLVHAAGATIAADAAVLATPAFVTAPIVRGVAPVAAGLLDQVDYASVVLVTLAARRSDIGHPLDASGLLVPPREATLLTACSFGSSKWPHWTPSPERVVLRLSAGRHRDRRAVDLDDEDVVEALSRELAPLLRWSGDVLEWRVSRWVDAFPQYAVGHQSRLDALERDMHRALPGVEIAGAGYRGLGVPACINQGETAALRLLVGRDG